MKSQDQQLLEEAYIKINEMGEQPSSNNGSDFERLKFLIKAYFNDDLQRDETPSAAIRRKKIKEAVLEIVK
jgi:hypothetical protein